MSEQQENISQEVKKDEKKEENISTEKKEEKNEKNENSEQTENTEEISTNKTSNIENNDILEPDIDPNTYCHRIFYKGSNIDINQFELFSFIKIKEKGSFLSNLGFKSPKITQIPYFAFLNETFLYMIKDKIYDKNKPNIRRIGNKYSLFDCQNIKYDTEEEYIVVNLEFMIAENDYKVKTLYFARNNYENFIRKFEKILIQYGIVTFHENEEEENENENDDIKNDDDNEEDDKKEVEEEKDNENQDDENIEKKHKKKKKNKKKREKEEEQ